MSRTNIATVTCDQCGKTDDQAVGMMGSPRTPDGWITISQSSGGKFTMETKKRLRADLCSQECLLAWVLVAEPVDEIAHMGLRGADNERKTA